MNNAVNPAALADAYMGLKFEERELKERLTAAKEEILETGLTELYGDIGIVTVTERKGSTSFDKKATLSLLRSLGASEEQIAAVIVTGESSTVLNTKVNLALAA